MKGDVGNLSTAASHSCAVCCYMLCTNSLQRPRVGRARTPAAARQPPPPPMLLLLLLLLPRSTRAAAAAAATHLARSTRASREEVARALDACHVEAAAPRHLWQLDAGVALAQLRGEVLQQV